jgi:hypothetical protein
MYFNTNLLLPVATHEHIQCFHKNAGFVDRGFLSWPAGPYIVHTRLYEDRMKVLGKKLKKSCFRLPNIREILG